MNEFEEVARLADFPLRSRPTLIKNEALVLITSRSFEGKD